MHVISAYVN